ncbi:hypothetical protein V8E53_006037 [Lactarius tabidus]
MLRHARRIQQLLVHSGQVDLAACSAQKANEAMSELKDETGKQAIFLQLGLSDLPAVRKSVQEFLSAVIVSPRDQLPHKSMTCNSAQTSSVGACPVRVNHALNWVPTYMPLAIYKLASLTLLPPTDVSSLHEIAQIVAVSSPANYLTTGPDFDAIADGSERTIR